VADNDDLDKRAAAAARAAILPDVLWLDDVAAALGLSRDTASRLIRERRIPGRKLAGRWFVERQVFLEAIRPEFVPCSDCTRLVPVTESDAPPICAACDERLRVAKGGQS